MEPQSNLSGGAVTKDGLTVEPQIALSSRIWFHRWREAIPYAREKGYQGIEWYLDTMRLPAWRGLRERFFTALTESGLAWSFHAPANDCEIALKEKVHARAALDYLRMYLDFLAELAPFLFTLHIGARHIPMEELSRDLLSEHLKILVDHGRSRGIRVCVENLTHGWTSDPDGLREMVEAAGARIVFDVGHAAGGPWVKAGKGTVVDFLDRVAPNVAGAHVYELENERGDHLPAGPGTRILPVLDRLGQVGCRWWVLELNSREETEETLEQVRKFVSRKA
jgi:sugar phosphate isomerase/epimerase